MSLRRVVGFPDSRGQSLTSRVWSRLKNRGKTKDQTLGSKATDQQTSTVAFIILKVNRWTGRVKVEEPVLNTGGQVRQKHLWKTKTAKGGQDSTSNDQQREIEGQSNQDIK